MKQAIKTLSVLAFLSMAGTVTASPLTLIDNYIGNGDSGTNERDVIGSSMYQINSLTVTNGGKNTEIKISTNYDGTNNTTAYGTEMGDIFFNINGNGIYNPKTLSSDDDFYTTGTIWTQAFVFEYADIYGETDGQNTGGGFALYDLVQDGPNDTNRYGSDIDLSNMVHNGGIRRKQAVRVNHDSESYKDLDFRFGTWAVDTGWLTLTFGNDKLGGFSKFDAIRWQMTCANDVIEGAPVPEPATMLLFGIGLIGIAGVSRRVTERR